MKHSRRHVVGWQWLLTLCCCVWAWSWGGACSPSSQQEAVPEQVLKDAQAEREPKAPEKRVVIDWRGDPEDWKPEPDRVAVPDDPSLPPRICRKPEALGKGPYFRDISKQLGLGGDGRLKVTGNRISTFDLNGDGYPEVMVHRGGSTARDSFDPKNPKRYRWLLWNRPDPKDPSRRMLVDGTEMSRYLQNAKPGVKGRTAHFAIAGDVNNDGFVDLFSATFSDANKALFDNGDRSVVLLGQSNSQFRLVTKQSAITPPNGALWSTTAATFLDYDRDGLLDVFVGFWYARYGRIEALQDRLYRGRGDGTFEDVTTKVGLTTKPFTQGYQEGTQHRPTYGVTSCDVDGDGDTDLIVSAYGRQPNMLYLNKNGRFEEVGQATKVAGDALQSYQDNEFYRCYCRANAGKCKNPSPPRVQCPARAPWNPSLDDKAVRLNGNTFTTACGDVNNDGRMDLYNAEIRHWHIGSSSDPSQLLLNFAQGQGFLFERPGLQSTGTARKHSGVTWDEGDISASFLDFDNDGRLDIYLASSDYPKTRGHLFHQLPSSDPKKPQFTEIGLKAGVGHPRVAGLSVVDLDRDGDLDILVGFSTMRCRAADKCPWKQPVVIAYENLVGQRSNWLQIQLKGKGKGGANRLGIGAQIRVTAGGVTQTRQINGGFGHSGLQNGLVAHFGLGASCDVTKIEVRWPNKSKSVQVFNYARANYRIVIEEGNDKITYLK